MKKKFKIDSSDLELDIEPGNCDECYYNHVCTSLKDPINPDDNDIDFQDFCLEYIEDDNGSAEVMPVKGTLEENLPYIFPDVILDKMKENKELKDTLNNYCEFFCSFECMPDCPMNKYKKK